MSSIRMHGMHNSLTLRNIPQNRQKSWSSSQLSDAKWYTSTARMENPEFYEENCLLPHSNHNCRFPNEGTSKAVRVVAYITSVTPYTESWFNTF